MNVDWDSIVKWEDDNESLVMWALTIDCIKERAAERNIKLKANDNQIFEFCYFLYQRHRHFHFYPSLIHEEY